MVQTLVVQCKYGWGQTLRLYTERLELQGISYALYDLVHFRSAYRRIVGLSALRLDLQFKGELIYVRGITDIDAGLQATLYLNSWLNKQAELAQEQQNSNVIVVPSVRVDTAQTLQLVETETVVPVPLAPLTPSLPHDQAEVVVDIVERSATENVTSQELQLATPPPLSPALEEVETVPVWSRAEDLPTSMDHDAHAQRKQRLIRLQTERELHLYGFDISALEHRLQLEGLPNLRVSLHLQRGEIAHYCSEASLCDEPPEELRLVGAQWKTRDRGTFILTNQRTIFQGHKRQLVLYHNRLLQLTHLPGAIMLHAEYWTQQQFFVMPRPLECAIYFDHILRLNQRKQQQLYLKRPDKRHD